MATHQLLKIFISLKTRGGLLDEMRFCPRPVVVASSLRSQSERRDAVPHSPANC
jgi:hypothetical protein